MTSPTLLWFRRDLRLGDHPALAAACKEGPVIPVFIRDASVDGLGAAPKWRLGLGLERLAQSLKEHGSDLVLRSGPALEVLRELIGATGATCVFWTRLYDPEAQERDSEIKSVLKSDGIEAKSFGGHLMFEPWTVETGSGSYYKVYTPFWRAVKDREVEAPLPPPGKVPAPDSWPQSDSLEDWSLGAAMRRGAEVVRPYVQLGEEAARDRLDHFIDEIAHGYDQSRDRPDQDGTSRLSQNLTLGEISPHQCWHAALRALQNGTKGAETFLKELVWREFAYHLMHHTPRLTHANWREDWDGFPWNEDERRREVIAWKRGRTGVRFVDAAQREMYVTGTMHNRGRMIVASYLTKHLMCHWKIGLKWFEDCLIDWDPASERAGLAMVGGVGSGCDALFPRVQSGNAARQVRSRARVFRSLDRGGHVEPPPGCVELFRRHSAQLGDVAG